MKRLVAVVLALVLLVAGSSAALANGPPWVTDTSKLIQSKVVQVPMPWQFWAIDLATGKIIDRIRISPTWLNPPGGLPAGIGTIFVKRQVATTGQRIPLEDLVWGTTPVPGASLQWTQYDNGWVPLVVGQDLELEVIPPAGGGAVLVAYEVKTDGGGGGGGGGAADEVVARFINEAQVTMIPGAPPQIIQILVNFDIHNNTGRNDITNFELDFAKLAFTADDVVAAIGFVKAHGLPPVDFIPPIPWGANQNFPLVVRPMNNGADTEVKWIETDRPLITCDWLHVGLVFNYQGGWVNNVNATVQAYWTVILPPPPPVPEWPAGSLLGLGLFGGLLFLIMKRNRKIVVS